ncbi:MAG: NADH-quinone oxidoreductase subunit J [Gammaproteobacteria bacterium]|nr:MAG: NADH-quinone oxidoreductase subunit J [Gammaproteobacteria bacterium]
MFELVIFYLFAALTVMAATAVVTLRNPVFAVLALILAFFSAAVIWMLLEAEFLAIVLVVVYVGAVMVLFLYVVMMLDINLAVLKEGFAHFLPLGALMAVLTVYLMARVLGPDNFGLDRYYPPVSHGPGYSNTRELGLLLYTDYFYAFEIAAVILLVAMVAAITLTLRRRKDRKFQRPEEQVAVRRDDFVRVVKMSSEES